MDNHKKVELSKTILDMKFMKRTKERAEKDKEEAKDQRTNSKNITKKMGNSGHINFIQANISHCKDLIDGRLSFGGMNPKIEKLMENDYQKKLEAFEKTKEKEVSDIEMAKSYSTVIHTINNKFEIKNEVHKKKVYETT